MKNYKIKTQIPKKIKELVWDKYISIRNGIGLCQCCQKTEITQMSFQCGHIISENNGGKIDITNLAPICSLCNLSMGTRNMDEFIKTHNLPFNEKIFNISDIKNFTIYDDNFECIYNKLNIWIDQNKKIPICNSLDHMERFLSNFIKKMRFYIWCSKEQFEKIKDKITKLENLLYWFWAKKNYFNEQIICINIKKFILKHNKLPIRDCEDKLLKTCYGNGIVRTYDSYNSGTAIYYGDGYMEKEHFLAVWCNILQQNNKNSYLSKDAYECLEELKLWKWNFSSEKLQYKW